MRRAQPDLAEIAGVETRAADAEQAHLDKHRAELQQTKSGRALISVMKRSIHEARDRAEAARRGDFFEWYTAD